jgi:2-oxoglutarate dehydrogenase E2 component (dihydrolipoamide succinyltransferase)
MNIVVPELGESVVEARVAKWLRKAGDRVAAGDPLVELETEKIDLEVSADRAGVLQSIAHAEGADVKVGEVLAVLDENAAEGAEPAPPAPAAAAGEPAPPAAAPSTPAPAASAPAAADGRPDDIRATPTARNVAKAHDVKIESVAASGPRVTKGDVLRAATPTSAAPAARPDTPGEARRIDAAATAPAAAPKPAAARPATAGAPGRGETRERMTKRRATIARRLVEA